MTFEMDFNTAETKMFPVPVYVSFFLFLDEMRTIKHDLPGRYFDDRITIPSFSV